MINATAAILYGFWKLNCNDLPIGANFNCADKPGRDLFFILGINFLKCSNFITDFY